MDGENIKPLLLSRRHRRKIIVSMILAALLYLSVVVYLGYEQALSAFVKIGMTGWVVLLFCSFSSYSIRYFRWQYYLKLNRHYLPHGLSFLYYLSAFALTTTPGKVGETVRSVLLRPHGIPYHTSLACFFVERFLDLIVITLFSLLIWVHFQSYVYYAAVFMLVLILVFPVIRHDFLYKVIKKLHRYYKNSRMGHFAGHVANMLKYARELLLPTTLYTGLLFGVIAWGVQGMAFYFVLSLLGLEINVSLAIGIYAISLLAGAASFIPGGIGSTELVMGLLLSASGADSGVAIAAPLISRLSTLWFAVLVGLAAAWRINMLRLDIKP